MSAEVHGGVSFATRLRIGAVVSLSLALFAAASAVWVGVLV